MRVDLRNSRNVERNENLEGRVTCGQQVWARVIRSLARQRGEQPFACVVGLRQPLACTRFDCGDLGVPGVGVAVGASRVWPSSARGLTQHARAVERNEQAKTCVFVLRRRRIEAMAATWSEPVYVLVMLKY